LALNLAIVGLQWGDEGKGKIVDLLAEKYDCVARYQGGHNAGHTVIFSGRRHVLHLIPSGIFHPNTTCVIGSGVVLDPLALIEEMQAIEKEGAVIKDRLFVSNRCHVILPYHRVQEAAIETLGRLRDVRALDDLADLIANLVAHAAPFVLMRSSWIVPSAMLCGSLRRCR